MKQRVALDFDGVIARTGLLKQRWVAENSGILVAENDTCRSRLLPIIGEVSYKKMQTAVGHAQTLTAPPFDGCIEAIALLKKKCTFVAVSARPKARLFWLQVWLRERNIHIEAYSCGKVKAETAIALGCTTLIDDDERHLAHPVTGDFRRIAFGASVMHDKGIECASNWAEVLKMLDRDLIEEFMV